MVGSRRNLAPERSNNGSCSEKVTDGLVNRLIAVTHTLKTVTCHSGRYTRGASDLRVSNVLGRRPMIIAVENAEVDTREHCGLARSTPLQRGNRYAALSAAASR